MNILKVLTDKRLKGNIGESGVVKFLKRQRYKILRRNYVADGHEIDIIARDKEHICFVEVKTRTTDAKNTYSQRPAEAVDYEKRKSIISAARIFASVHREDGYKFRFDVAEVHIDKNKKITEINYLENAFTADSDRRKRF